MRFPCKVKSKSGPKIVTWADGTDEEIVAMLEAHYAGEIDIHDYWTVGDERTVNLSAMSAMSPLTDAHVAQSVTYVLSHSGGKYLSDGITECAFQVDQKNGLLEEGKINSARRNVWSISGRRTWCNTVYRNAVPSTLVGIFKEFINQSGKGNRQSGVENTNDYFSLRAEIEVLGSTTNSTSGEGSQASWYETSSNRLKYPSDDSGLYTEPYNWGLRSPVVNSDTLMCYITGAGTSKTVYADTTRMLSPFCVI